MPVSEARKKANAKWDLENMVTMSCRIKKDIAVQFRQKCADNGQAPNTVLREFILQYIGNKE